MNQLISTGSKISAFVIGSVFGCILYGVYLWLGLDGDFYYWLASDGIFVTTFGSIFFPVQYLIFSFGDYWTFSDITTMVVCFCLVALLYGYIFLSFRLFPVLAIGTFTVSIIVFLFSMVAFADSNNPIFGILFWPMPRLHEFVVAANVPTGPALMAGYCCILGLWYAALICGLWTLIKYPRFRVKTKVPSLVPGWFVGECANTTMGVSANLLLIIHGANNAGIYGKLCLSGELGGGGDFHGTLESSDLVFSTCVPADQILIEWRGKITDGHILGTYIVTINHPDSIQADQQRQLGKWSCAFVRGNAQPDPAGLNEVYVYNQGKADGPFTREKFDQLVRQERWPVHAIIAAEDRTFWTRVADYLEKNAADETKRN